MRQSQVLWRRIVDVYGDYDPAVFSAITRANPQIRNPHRIASGAEIRFPALPAPRNPLPGDLYWVQVAAKGSLAEANEVLYSSPVDPPIRLFPYWNSREGLVFALLLKKGFTGEEAAREALLRLQPLWGPGAKVIRGWQPDTVFYARH